MGLQAGTDAVDQSDTTLAFASCKLRRRLRRLGILGLAQWEHGTGSVVLDALLYHCRMYLSRACLFESDEAVWS